MLVVAQLGIATPADPGEKIVKAPCVQYNRIEGSLRRAERRRPRILRRLMSMAMPGWKLAVFEMGELQILRFIFKKGALCLI
jgi:hypothetical protein